MVQVTIIDSTGQSHALTGNAGQNVMELAVNHDIPGIVGECGGDLSCGTCHVYVEAPWDATLGKASTDETDMLEVVDHLRPASRLCCQLVLSDALDGLIVSTPRDDA